MSVGRGIAYYAASQLCLVVDGTVVHHLGEGGLDVGQMVLLRGVGSAVLLTALARDEGFAIFRTPQPGAQVMRGLLTLVSLWLIFHSLSHLPLADAAALNYTRAVWITLMGAVFLGEAVPARRWIATGTALAGAMVVIGPAFVTWNPAYVTALAGAATNGAAVVASRHLNRRDGPMTTMAYLTAVSLVGTLPAAFQPLPWGEWPFLSIIAVAGALSTWFFLQAVRHADASLLAPYDYTRLPITMLFGYLLFGEVPLMTTFAGSAAIAFAGLSLFLLERQRQRPASKTGTETKPS